MFGLIFLTELFMFDIGMEKFFYNLLVNNSIWCGSVFDEIVG